MLTLKTGGSCNTIDDLYTEVCVPNKVNNMNVKSKTVFGPWKHFKSDEKCFLFYLKSSFCSQDI